MTAWSNRTWLCLILIELSLTYLAAEKTSLSERTDLYASLKSKRILARFEIFNINRNSLMQNIERNRAEQLKLEKENEIRKNIFEKYLAIRTQSSIVRDFLTMRY